MHGLFAVVLLFVVILSLFVVCDGLCGNLTPLLSFCSFVYVSLQLLCESLRLFFVSMWSFSISFCSHLRRFVAALHLSVVVLSFFVVFLSLYVVD